MMCNESMRRSGCESIELLLRTETERDSFLSIVIIGCTEYYSPTHSVDKHRLFAARYWMSWCQPFMHLRPTLR